MVNIEEIKALVQLFEASSLSELSLQRDGAQLTLKRVAAGQVVSSASAPAPAMTPPASELAMPTEALHNASSHAPAQNGHAVTSPLVGTFYSRPSPDEAPYVDAGSEVKKGDTLCIVEAMKVMNEIKADLNGTVLDVLVEDAAIVEYGQPLIVLEPK